MNPAIHEPSNPSVNPHQNQPSRTQQPIFSQPATFMNPTAQIFCTHCNPLYSPSFILNKHQSIKHISKRVLHILFQKPHLIQNIYHVLKISNWNIS
jgi:hypothetical protein